MVQPIQLLYATTQGAGFRSPRSPLALASSTVFRGLSHMPLPIIMPRMGHTIVKNALGMVKKAPTHNLGNIIQKECTRTFTFTHSLTTHSNCYFCFYFDRSHTTLCYLFVFISQFLYAAMSVRDVFFNIVCPTLGVIIALTMFSTPMRSVLRARREKALGDLNPVPWVVTFVNCMGWVIYACFKL